MAQPEFKTSGVTPSRMPAVEEKVLGALRQSETESKRKGKMDVLKQSVNWIH